ncbi:MAG: Peptidase superfamily [Frankiales bacterium]|nr:Peptidase superfamily [Frankiales bacterium]
MGMTYLDDKRIAMYVRPCGSQSVELLRHVMAHELGHAHDTELMSAADRRAWLAARGIPASTPWYGCSGCTDFATPAGDFAEVYAQWARGASTNRSQLAGDVGRAQLAALARRFF